MVTSTLFFLALSFSAVSTDFIHPSVNRNAISSYCAKSQQSSLWYGRVPIECCDSRGQCDRFIGPGETSYGLYNPDPTWTRRFCSCDVDFYYCVKNANPEMNEWLLNYGFSSEYCFQQKFITVNGISIREGYEFVPLKNALETEIPSLKVHQDWSFRGGRK